MKTLSVPIPNLNSKEVGYFRYGVFDKEVLLTNDAGEWQFLSEEDFHHLIAGELSAEHPQYAELQSKGFLRKGLDIEELATRVRRKKSFLGQGPHLHIVITTLRCNQSCKYCHASRADMDRVDTDMSLETARHAVDLAMQSTSPYVCFEYTGGEPSINMDVIRFMVEYSREKNRHEKKYLDHSIVTNMTYMTEEKADFFIDNDIWVCTSLDGPENVHNWNRGWRNQNSAYESVVYWIKRFREKYIARGRDPELYHVDALMTTTRKSLDRWKDLIDLYVSLGIRNIHLRPLNPFGFASKTWKVIGYSMQEYMEFYEKALNYILELNEQGVQIMEGTAATFLKKILRPDDPNFVDLRSPIGSGTGQLAYNYNGNIYPSDEGRMVAAMGDEFFLLGKLGQTTYDDVVQHSTVKTLALSSILDSLPSCHSCWNAPYCGVRPLHNYMQYRDLFAQRPLTPKCHEHMSISKLLFSKIKNDKSENTLKIFRRWIIDRPRE
ncbi:MAG: His-Xaa-Ser system radical SAM maturase HxsB [Myxococcota bacterium]|nr:His-Xaa-Ser system radical SAM maturase HxsB [Myxococcota bacterium]